MEANEEFSLSDLIEQSISVEDPVEDNLDVETEDEGDDILESLLSEVQEDDDDVESEDDSSDDSEPGEVYQVKVDGELVEVTLDEALAGYQRQADYTRKAQALAQEREEFALQTQEFQETLDTLQSLDQAWEENPVQVLANFTANTENPTHSVALLIKELASANMLDRDFLDMFGITPEVQKVWAQEGEVDTLRRKVSKTEQAENEVRARKEYEAQVANATAQYERDIDDILSSEGLTDITVSQRETFKRRLATYAYENELTNLKAAYKALKYEETQKKADVAKRTRARVEQKKNARAVGRSGAGAAGSAPVTDGTDLQAIIAAAMDSAGSA